MSLAVAVRTCEPFTVLAVSQDMVYGEDKSSAPRFTPSSLNCTPATELLSEAVAETVTAPETAVLLAGAVIEMTGACVSLKAAVMAVFPLTVTEQVLPETVEPQLDHEVVKPEAGAAINVTCVPLVKEYEQVEPQLMPEGLLVTFPLPALVTVMDEAGRAWVVDRTIDEYAESRLAESTALSLYR